MRYIKICSILCIILLSGCATFSGKSRFEIGVDSLALSNASLKKTYLLLPGNKGVTPADLQFQEYAAYLKRVLGEKGYTYTTSEDKADLVIYLAYGLGDPETYQYAYSLPVWGRTGYYATRSHVAETSKDGKTTYKSITTYVPSYGFAGYETYVGSGTAYSRFAVITAYDYDQFKKDEKEVQLWKTTITSVGMSDDLRRVFPVLLAASAPYLATDTGHKVYVSLSETDDAVMKVKGIAAGQK